MMTATAMAATPYDRAAGWLAQCMDQYHSNVFVYADASCAGNHFSARGKMGDAANVLTMNEACTNHPFSGLTCIEAKFLANGSNWGGWYFMNGVLLGSETSPRENWGTYAHSGVNLQGAPRLKFRAKGRNGGERVEFFVGNVGRNEAGNPIASYPDSSSKATTGFITLSTVWEEHTIDLAGRDLSYVLGGFGWVTSANSNGGHDVTFYLDDIRYELPRLDQPRFLLSYQTIGSTNAFDLVMRNVAYVYDNAVACMAFLANGQTNRALLIADALVYALDHDRYYSDGRLRNAYQAGDLMLPPGWFPNGKTNTVRMPGWYDPISGQWLEDRTQVGTSAGNQAWAMLALLYCYEATGRTNSNYLAAAMRMGEWLETNCRDSRGAGGYTGGVDGWEPTPSRLTYKSTEHNTDILAAFSWLFGITADDKWSTRATYARAFLQTMYDSSNGRYWTGTQDDGVATNTNTVPLDVQFWVPLAMGVDGVANWRGTYYAESRMRVGGGYDFNEDCDGVWREGTGIAADGFLYAGQPAKQQAILAYLVSCQDASGGFHAADHDGLTTGFTLSDGNPWLYYHRLHVAPAAWFLIASSRLNPFSGKSGWQTEWNYTTNNSAISISGYTGFGGAVAVPSRINGLPVTDIGTYAFFNCSSLTSVTIPSNVTSVGDLAFGWCSRLTSIVVDPQNSVYCSVAGVLFDKNQTTLIQCPGGKAGNYAVPSGVTNIASSALNGCTSLTSVTIPASVTRIGNYAFDWCISLTGIYFHGNAPSVGSDVIAGDDNASAYYLAGTTGWGSTFGGRPTAQWNILRFARTQSLQMSGAGWGDAGLWNCGFARWDASTSGYGWFSLSYPLQYNAGNGGNYYGLVVNDQALGRFVEVIWLWDDDLNQ